MNRILFSIVSLTVFGFFLATPVLSMQPIPKESGISGFINVGAGGISVENNMIAGNSLGDIGNKRISSLTDSPDSNEDMILVLSGELAYTFASTRTQLFFGNSLEDFIRFETATLVGVRQELSDNSLLEASFVFSGIPTEVWADPYVVDQNRSETDRTATGMRLGYDKILGSDFQIQFTWRNIEVDDELSGLTQLVEQGDLTVAQTQLLDREGNSYQFEVLHPFRFEKGKHVIVPAFNYTRLDLNGEAMANDRYQGQVTYFYTGEIFNVAANLLYAYADYDETNPIYLKTQNDNIYGGTLSAFYKNLLGVEQLNLVGTIAAVKSDANIDFYDTKVGFLSLSVLYRF